VFQRFGDESEYLSVFIDKKYGSRTEMIEKRKRESEREAQMALPVNLLIS
jgi:hypothetical protein